MTDPFRLIVARGNAASNTYLEVATPVPTFILAGHYFEARFKRRAGVALPALLRLGANDVAVLRPGAERALRWRHASSISGLIVTDRFVVRPGE